MPFSLSLSHHSLTVCVCFGKHAFPSCVCSPLCEGLGQAKLTAGQTSWSQSTGAWRAARPGLFLCKHAQVWGLMAGFWCVCALVWVCVCVCGGVTAGGDGMVEGWEGGIPTEAVSTVTKGESSCGGWRQFAAITAVLEPHCSAIAHANPSNQAFAERRGVERRDEKTTWERKT